MIKIGERGSEGVFLLDCKGKFSIFRNGSIRDLKFRDFESVKKKSKELPNNETLRLAVEKLETEHKLRIELSRARDSDE